VLDAADEARAHALGGAGGLAVLEAFAELPEGVPEIRNVKGSAKTSSSRLAEG
jgi:hypothetical protein